MASEESPLLGASTDPAVLEHELVYQRFSRSQKNYILGLISLVGITPCEFISRVIRRHFQHGFFTSMFCSVRIWDIVTGQCKFVLTGHTQKGSYVYAFLLIVLIKPSCSLQRRP